MAEDEEQLIDGNVAINTVTISNETPSERFRITIELPLFLVMTGMSLCGAALSNIVMYRACVHDLGHSKDECMVFLSLQKNNRPDLENEVQKYMTTLSTVRSVIEAVIPAVLSLFMGVWSDIHGRKPLLVWPLFGLTVTSLLQVGYCVVDLGAWWFVPTILPYSISGGFTIFFTGAFCYLSDITSTKDRSLRMTILESSTSIGSIIGALLSSHALRLVGYTWLIVIAAAFNVVAYAFTNVYIRESLTGALRGGITTIFDLLLVKEMIRECFKRRVNNGRAQILLLTFANSLSILILYGQISLAFYYTREKLHWTLSDYTLFDAISTSIYFVGSFIGIGLLQKLLGLNDLVSSNIAFICAMTEFIIRAAAIYTWHMYLGAALAIFKGLSAPLIRSYLTKVLPIVDIAKVFALLSAIEGLCPLVAPLLYNSLYWYTITIFPGAIYVLSTVIIGICITCLSSVQYLRWNMTSQYQRLETVHS